MTWRPEVEEWEQIKREHCNLVSGKLTNCEHCPTKPMECNISFEAGADAILEALKTKGAFMTPEQMELLTPDRKYPYGWLVFIPVEEKDGRTDKTSN